MGLFKREQPQPMEPSMKEQAGEIAKEVIEEEGYKMTPEGLEARKYLDEKWENEEAPHRKAIETMAYVAIPEFTRNHPGQSIEPEDLIPNREFNEIRAKLSESFGVSGATVPISDEDVKHAINLAKEYLGNQVEPEEESGENMAAA